MATDITSAKYYLETDRESFAPLVSKYGINNAVEIYESVEVLYLDAFKVYADDYHCDVAYALESFQDAYCGEHDSEEDYAEYVIDEGLMGEIPENIAGYIDYEKLARDLFINDMVFLRDDESGIGYVFYRM